MSPARAFAVGSLVSLIFAWWGSSSNMDFYYHDTYIVVSGVHLFVSIALWFALCAAIYGASRGSMSGSCGKIHFWLTAGGVLCVTVAWYAADRKGHAETTWMLLLLFGIVTAVTSQVLLVWNLLRAMVRWGRFRAPGSGIVVLAAASLTAVPALSQQKSYPNLYLATYGPQGRRLPATAQPIEILGNHRIRFVACVEARTVSDAIEQPEIQARNQHPDYFRHRPPASVTLSVHRVEGRVRTPVLFRVISSGHGKNLTVHYVDIEIDVLDEKTARDAKLRSLVERLMAEAGRPRDPQTIALMAAGFDEMYVDSPAGLYEIVAQYRPSTPENWKGSLVSAPLLVQVSPGPDFIEELRKRSRRPH